MPVLFYLPEVCSILEVQESQEVAVIGTIYKNMKWVSACGVWFVGDLVWCAVDEFAGFITAAWVDHRCLGKSPVIGQVNVAWVNHRCLVADVSPYVI